MGRLTGTPQRVAARVNAAIERSDLSKSDVSDITGIPRETLRRRLAGINAFDVDELERIAQALGMDWVQFTRDEAKAS